jgi:hypothetical protein
MESYQAFLDRALPCFPAGTVLRDPEASAGFRWVAGPGEHFATAVNALPAGILADFGFKPFSELGLIVQGYQPEVDAAVGTGNVLLLFPGEWLDIIPDGSPLITIHGERVVYDRATADNLCRKGCLIYGIAFKAPTH